MLNVMFYTLIQESNCIKLQSYFDKQIGYESKVDYKGRLEIHSREGKVVITKKIKNNIFL